MSVSTCCLKSFRWEGTPVGQVGKLGAHDAYITGNNTDAAVLIVHDLLGWAFPNVRLLADHYAQEANVTVYVPDFFHGQSLPIEPILNRRYHEIDIDGFLEVHSRQNREEEIFVCARSLREKYKKVGAVGFCYGGWAVFRLGAKENQPPLVDCITTGHPSMLTKEDIAGVAVPTQVLAPELDPIYVPELKSYTFETLPKAGIPFDYQHFPGVEHACLVRGSPDIPGEQAALVRGKDAAVNWLKLFLHEN
ncbi:dienelactone hydrolase family protein [Thozetella sp. PMI_491]|nr:dienelactone hydrolase family protein [Thozetella sp. PMI_491]